MVTQQPWALSVLFLMDDSFHSYMIMIMAMLLYEFFWTLSFLFIYLFIYTFIPFFNLFIMYCSYKDIDSLYLSGGFFFIFSFLPIFLHCVNCIFFFSFFFGSKFRHLAIIIKKVEQIPVQRIFIFLKKKWHNFFAIFLSF